MVQSVLLRPKVLRIPRSLCARAPCRCKSITAAIERGRNSWAMQPGRAERRTRNAGDKSLPRTGPPISFGLPQSAWDERDPDKLSRSSPITDEPAYTKSMRKGHDRIVQSRRPESYEQLRQVEENLGRPESLPYTTAASEFIYGYSSVLAALKANRRALYKLYIHRRGLAHPRSDALITRARALRIKTQEVGDEHEQALDKASSGRPHNGFILEASPLPVPPLTSLQSSSIMSGRFEVVLAKQSMEDAQINGTQKEYTYKSAGWRHPLILCVDGVLDEGNLGAIARSAYFLGVDAIVTPTRQSAPWSHIALKASAGAAEAIPIFKTNQATDFLGQSARAGWRIYASDSIPPAEQPSLAGALGDKSLAVPSSDVIYTQARSAKRMPVDHCPVESYPTILMMGAEGSGLRSSLLNLAHFKVGIRHGRDVDEIGVDSLNVSVAASLLCYQMLQKPKPRTPGNLLF